MSGIDVQAIRVRHVKRQPAQYTGAVAWCGGCKSDWPCESTRLLDEVARLTAVVERVEASAADAWDEGLQAGIDHERVCTDWWDDYDDNLVTEDLLEGRRDYNPPPPKPPVNPYRAALRAAPRLHGGITADLPGQTP